MACFPGWRRRGEGGGVVGECCLQASFSLRWRFSPASAVESWSFELEVGTGASSPWSGDVAAGLLLLQGYGACFRVGGRWPAGSEPTFPRRRRWSSLASSDPGAGGGGAPPRSIGDRRRLLQLRLLSKPVCDVSSSAQGGARLPLRWRWPAARRTVRGGLRKIQEHICNFCFGWVSREVWLV